VRALAETLRLGWFGGCQFHPYLFQHSRQRHREGEEGLSRYGELFMSAPVIGLLGHCPRSARAPGASNASQGRAGFFPSRVLYPPHSRHKVLT
jgi:hypothetical protein